MPYSYSFFKEEIKQWFIDNVPTTAKILDVGPGEGAYSILLSDAGYKMDCVEIWKPYIEQFNLNSKYDNVVCGNILNIELVGYDFIIFGDVLEHLDYVDAQRLINNAIESSMQCLVAIPYMMEQGEWDGNPYEEHKQPDLTPENMIERYPMLKLIYGNEFYGYYILK